MPYLDLPPDLKLYYTIDDYTDPWAKPDTVLFVHGANENTDAWRPWMPHLSRYYRYNVSVTGTKASGMILVNGNPTATISNAVISFAANVPDESNVIKVFCKSAVTCTDFDVKIVKKLISHKKDKK